MSRPLACLCTAAVALLSSHVSADKAPAYTFKEVGFSTHLKNLPDGERREECVDDACKEPPAVVVAEGHASVPGGEMSIAIKEHKRAKVKADALSELAGKVLARAPRGREVRKASGEAGKQPSLDQWGLYDECSATVFGRAMVAMPDKVIEIEVRAPLGEASAQAESLAKVQRVLRGLRVRRLGDAVLAPSEKAPDAGDVAPKADPRCGA